MKFRSLLDLIIRPIPAAETPDAVRARRTGDYVVAAILGLFVLAGLYWGLHRQITQAPGDFSDRDPKKVDEPEKPRDAVEVQLTFTPGEEEIPARIEDGISHSITIYREPLVERGVFDRGAKIQDEVRAYGETVRSRMEVDLRAQADALARDVPPPTFVELPPRTAPVVAPPPAEPPAVPPAAK